MRSFLLGVLICVLIIWNVLMNTDKLLVDKTGLVLVIECRRDSLGKECFTVVYSDRSIRFRNMSSVLDFIEMNKGNLDLIK